MANFLKNWFNKVPIDVEKYSGYDEPNEHFFTAKVGQLVPADVTEIIPGDVCDLGVSAQIQLPPMATDFYGRVDAKFFTFFVPHRLVYGGFEATLNVSPETPYNPDITTGRFYIPGCASVPHSVLGPGSLADYLGYKVPTTITTPADIDNIMPFLSYHLIFSEWFRESRIQTEPFVRYQATGGGSSNRAARLPFLSLDSTSRLLTYGTSTTSMPILLDAVSIFETRQINWQKDYFTNATNLPQSGYSARVILPISVTGTAPSGGGDVTSTGNAQISMTSLFGANALQRWKEIKNISGGRFGDYQYSIFGIYPESYICDRPIYLGQHTIPVYNRSVFQQSLPGGTSPVTGNPFDVVGAKYSSPLGVGSGQLCSRYKFSEYGYLMTLFALVPYATYATGIDRMFTRYRSGDFANPIFAGVGDQEVYLQELAGGVGNNVFGYTQRFAEYKFKQDRVSGLLRDGESLDSFALQRSFTAANPPALGSNFLQIPQSYLDQVAAVNGDVSTYGCWVDAAFRRKILRKLPAYSIGTLADPKHTETKLVDNGGKRLS